MRLGPLGGIRPGMGVTGAPNLPQGERRLGYSPHTGTNNGLGVVRLLEARHGPCAPRVCGWATDGTCPDAVTRIGVMVKARPWRSAPIGADSPSSARVSPVGGNGGLGLRGRRAAGHPALGTARNMHSSHAPGTR